MAIPELKASISVWGPDHSDQFSWSMLVGYPHSAFLCRIDSICWRKYKSEGHARAAAKRAAKKLGLTIVKE